MVRYAAGVCSEEPMGGSRMVELATDLTVREIARAQDTGHFLVLLDLILAMI